MFNNRIKVNIFLYSITLALEFIIKINMIIHMKKARNHKSLFIRYVSYIPVRIEDIIIRQSFFILECELIAYILERPFKIIIYL